MACLDFVFLWQLDVLTESNPETVHFIGLKRVVFGPVFVGQAKGVHGALQNSQNRQNRHEGYPPPPQKLNPLFEGTFKRGVTERGVFAFACQYIVSPRGRTGNRTVTQMRHPLFLKDDQIAHDNRLPVPQQCRRLASWRHHTVIPVATQKNVVTPCLLTPCLNVPKSEKTKGQQLKGKIVSALFHAFPHFFRFFPRGFLKIKAFL